jgi:hypothetical protein
METIRKIAEIDPRDLPLVERMFGQSLAGTAEGELVLRVPDIDGGKTLDDSTELPSWCDVLEGMSDEDRADFRATLDLPIRLALSD